MVSASGPVLSLHAQGVCPVGPYGRGAVVGSPVVDLATGSVGPELMNNLAISFSFAHWEDSTHVLTPVFPAEPPQDQPATGIEVRCDVTSGACEQAPTSASIM